MSRKFQHYRRVAPADLSVALLVPDSCRPLQRFRPQSIWLQQVESHL